MRWFLKPKTLAAYLVLLLPIVFIQYAFPRTEFTAFILCFSVAFAAYFFILKQEFQPSFVFGLVLRLSLLFSLPTLSDDFYRFYWDGILLLKSVNPYSFLPTEVPIDFEGKELLLQKMNSENYFSPYTPILQVLFAFCAWLGQSIFGFVIAFKLLIIGAEVITFFILKKLIGSSWKLTIWWLNPLIILEFTGNLHQEVFVVLGLALVFYFVQHKENKAMLAFVFTVACKLIPVIYLVAFFRSQKFSSFLKYAFASLIVLMTSYVLFFTEESTANYIQSIRYYFTVFEFNSSLFRIAQHLKDHVYGLLIYLPKVILILGFLGLAFFGNKKLKVNMLFCLAVFLLCSQSVHPWYVAPLVLFSVLTKYKFPVLWSFLIGFTYITYKTLPYEQSLAVICVEYALLLTFMFYEVFLLIRNVKNFHPPSLGKTTRQE